MAIVTSLNKKIQLLGWIVVIFCCLQSCRPKKILTDVGQAPAGLEVGTHHDVLAQYARLLDVPKSSLGNEKLYFYIQEWMGVPHRDAGDNKKGIDCSAFVGQLYRDVYRKDLPRTSAEMGATVTRKYEDQLQEGDLVFFSFGNRQIDHVGVYLHNGMFVHVSTSKGVIISRLKDPWYYKFFVRGGPYLAMKPV